MSDIKSYGFVRHLRSDANVHIMRFRKGTAVQTGRGLSFWFWPRRTSVSELPMDDRDMVLFDLVIDLRAALGLPPAGLPAPLVRPSVRVIPGRQQP